MSGLTISADRRHLLRDGATHVPLVDTVWNAFSEPTDEEWTAYVTHRRSQGFTGLLISLLPTLHDRSENPGSRLPFAQSPDGLDPSAIDPAYLARARRLAEEAVAAGFTIFLVVLWSNYVEGSPASAMPPAVTLPPEVRGQLPAIVHEHFAHLEPVLLISGDDPFTDPAAVAIYRDLLHACRERMPTSLTAFHLWPDGVLPQHLLDDAALDLTVIQSGHTADEGAKAIELATRSVSEPARPVLNLEPCYEAHGHVRGHGRFSRDEVRRVAWTSLTAGASAGLGYGAHGVWQWHRPGSRFTNGGFSGMPLPWTTALALPGADDLSFARVLWEDEGFAGALPDQSLLDRDDDGARAARRASAAVLYLPSSRPVRLGVRPVAVRAWDLALRRPLVPAIHADGDGVLIDPPDVTGDAVIILDLQRERP